MPRYCQFREDIKFHRSIASMPAASGVVGVGLVNSDVHTLRRNIRWIIPDVQEHMVGYPTFSLTNFVWCTREEYNQNWVYLANELLSMRLYVASGNPYYPAIPAQEMPKFSLGVTKNLDIIARDSRGRWVYFVKTDDSVEVTVSDIAPDCSVVCRVGDEDASRRLSKNRYWVAVRGSQYTLVRPPINCPDDIVVPFGGFLNSRFVFHGDYSYIMESSMCGRTFITDDGELSTCSYPAGGVYGQLVLHEKRNNMYMTLTPVYPDIFGCRLTRKLRIPLISAFDYDASPATFCSRLSDSYCINQSEHSYVDCLDGGSITVDNGLPVLYRGIPTNSHTFKSNFLEESGVFRSVWFRNMHVDEEGNKVYGTFDTRKFLKNILTLTSWSSVWNCLMPFDGENWRWDNRNSAWILDTDAVYVPPRASLTVHDVYTHSHFVRCTECPICHSKTTFSTRSSFVYFVNGRRRRVELCEHCLSTIYDGSTLEIPTEDGDVLYVDANNVCGCNGEYTLPQWWVRVPNEDSGLIDEFAAWNSETQQWELIDDNDGADYLALTPRGCILIERYCTHINGYFYKPDPIFFKGDDENTQKFFGIELEVMDGGESSINAKRVCRNHEELYAKHDGSLSDGMELVSHPCTVNWHLTHLWGDVLARLRTLQYTARTGSGIHVHVSTKYWENNGGTCRIANMIAFCDMNRDALRLYANRQKEMFDHWTHRYLSPSSTKKVVAETLLTFGDTEKAMQDLYDRYYNSTDHYSVVNLSNDSTVEIRAFASTLDINRMHSIIQFVDVLTELSTEATLAHPITFDLIKERAQNKGYNNLLEDPKFLAAIEASNGGVGASTCA